MFEATQYIPENDSVDWHALADQLFPADALLTTTTAFNPLALVRKSV